MTTHQISAIKLCDQILKHIKNSSKLHSSSWICTTPEQIYWKLCPTVGGKHKLCSLQSEILRDSSMLSLHTTEAVKEIALETLMLSKMMIMSYGIFWQDTKTILLCWYSSATMEPSTGRKPLTTCHPGEVRFRSRIAAQCSKLQLLSISYSHPGGMWSDPPITFRRALSDTFSDFIVTMPASSGLTCFIVSV